MVGLVALICRKVVVMPNSSKPGKLEAIFKRTPNLVSEWRMMDGSPLSFTIFTTFQQPYATQRQEFDNCDKERTQRASRFTHDELFAVCAFDKFRP